MKFALDVKNDRKVADGIIDLGGRATSAQPVLTAASEVLQAGLARNFRSRGGALGAPWSARVDGSPATLQGETGGLEAALTGGDGSFKRTTATMGIAGARGDSAFIARFHQGGTTRGLPARKVVGVSDTDQAVLLKMVERYLLGNQS